MLHPELEDAVVSPSPSLEASKPRARSRRNLLRAAAAASLCAVAGGGAAHFLTACDEGPDPGEFDENAMLRQIADNVMLPVLVDFDTSAGALEAAVSAFADGPTEATLATAREAWLAARAVWKQSQAFAFGPVKGDLSAAIDWVADPAAIDDVVATGGPFDSASVDKLGTNRKGMMALEYLLFDPEASDADVVARLEGNGAAFARALGQNLAAKATTLREAWDPSSGAYVDEFGNAGTTSDLYKSPKDALDALVNEILFLADTAANLIAAPLGLKTGGTPAPELEESRLSDSSLADVENRVRGIDAIWEGRFGDLDGLGLSDMAGSRSEALVSDVRNAIDKSFEALEAVPVAMTAALTEAPAELEAAFNAVIALKQIIGSDVVTVLGVTLTFNDNDGD